MSLIKSNAVAPPPPSGGLSSISEMNSLRFPNSGVLYTALATPDSVRKYTISLWVKLANQDTAFQCLLERARPSNYSQGLVFQNHGFKHYENGTQVHEAVTRDYSAWYHLMVAYDADAGYQKMWLNGRLNEVARSSDSQMAVGGSQWTLGKSGWSGVYPFKGGYIADVYYLDGVVPTVANGGLDADNNLQMLGERVSDIWVPKEYSGSYGNAGFHLDFADANNIGNDVSGRGNHWTVN